MNQYPDFDGRDKKTENEEAAPDSGVTGENTRPDPEVQTGGEAGAAPEAGQADYNEYGGNVQYKWNYDDYQKALASQSKPPKKKNKGLKVFLVSIASVAAVAVISLSGVGIAALIRDGGLDNIFSGSSQGTVPDDKAVNPNGPTLKTTDKPSTTAVTSSAASGSAITMSAEQVYNTVKNAIVTIETYDLQSMDPIAEGSGIVMSADGYIITNEHVIDGASSVEVVMADGKKYTADVKGKDVRTDLAVLKVDASGLTAATFGNSDQLKVAESVLAIGNPGGLEYAGSVTDGIISALNRIVTTESGYSETCIQTSAPINPGNSGGALVNMYGQVIGITSSKIAATGYEAMGFAIPINTAQPIINDLIKFGYVTGRVKMGISVSQYDITRAKALGYPAGVLVNSVDPSSDAAAKGIKANDIITKINGVDVSSYDDLYKEESKSKAGDTVKLTIFRMSGKSTFDVNVKLAEDKGDTASTTQQQQRSQGSTGGYGNSYGNGSTTAPFSY